MPFDALEIIHPMMTMSSRSRILIADDHKLVADLCKKLLETEFDVVGIVSDGRSMLRTAVDLKPDVIVVDIAMPILNGLDAGQKVKQVLPAVKLVYLTMNPDPEVAAEAFRRGASGYLLKTCAAEEMVIAVRKVLRGMSYISTQLPTDTVNYLRRQSKPLVEEEERLTSRQREVLQLIAEGKVMKEIGGILNMTPRTVAFHKYRMMDALGAKSSAELVRYAVRRNIIAA
jgi:DNA-binding NarL/FixJ family response regulator